MEDPNVDFIALTEMAVNEIDDGNIKNTRNGIREWAIENSMPREVADDFAGIVFDSYNKYDEDEGENEMDYEEMEDEFDNETSEYDESDDELLEASSDEEDDELLEASDNEDDDYEEDEVEDGEEAYAMKSAVASLNNMESHIYFQSEEIKVINKSLAVLAEALSSIIEMGEKQGEEMNLMKSKLGIMAESPSVNRNPVYSNTNSNSDLKMGGEETKSLLLKGALKNILSVNELSLYQQTGKLSDKAKQFILSEREGR